jgi:lipoic acid synthetase
MTLNSNTGVELLIPDFNAIPEQLETVFETRPEVLAPRRDHRSARLRPGRFRDREVRGVNRCRVALPGLLGQVDVVIEVGQRRHERAQGCQHDPAWRLW